MRGRIKTRGQIAMWNKLSFDLKKKKCAKQVSQHPQTQSVCSALMKENIGGNHGQIAMWMLTKLREPFSKKGSSKTRGQIAMWMLTKFAMIFFIGALALILLSVADIEKEGLCNVAAERTNKMITSAFIQVLNSPVEDERRIIPLESSLSIGKEDLARYEVNITLFEYGGRRELRIETGVAKADCGTGSRVPLEPDEELLEVQMGDEDDAPYFTLNPSKPSRNQEKRSRFLVIIKCRDKCTGATEYLLVQDCKQDDPARCIQFDGEGPKQYCGWEICEERAS